MKINFNPRTPCGVRQRNVFYESCWYEFQSTHPLRGATIGDLLELENMEISIHAPLAGCDLIESAKRVPDAISIHAPLAGCDDKDYYTGEIEQYFNPRTPCGVRLSAPSLTLIVITFQSTHPLRGATGAGDEAGDDRVISIHAPLAGCDSKIAEIFPANLRKSYKISAKPNKERCCRVLGKGKAAAISDLARCEPPGENRNASGSHQIMSAPSGA